MRCRVLVSTWVLAWLVSVFCYEAVAVELEDFSAGLSPREEVLKSARSVQATHYPDADDVVIDDHTFVSYREDGLAVQWNDVYIKVLTEKGKRENRTLSIPFQLPYYRVSVVLLEVVKSDGSSVPVNIEEQSRVMIERSQMGSNIYDPNSKLLAVGVPGLEVGDVLHYLTRSEDMKKVVPDTWSSYQVFEYTSPIKHAVYEVDAPKERPLKAIAIKDPVRGTVAFRQSEKGDRLRYHWELSGVPRMFPEPDMPQLSTVVQRLLVSTIGSWQEISDWYWKLSEPRLLATTPAMADKVAELVRDLGDRDRQIEAIFRWVSQEVRYLGITVEAEAPGYEPHDVSLTFEKRHGVCRDKAALLVSMLRLAGFPAYPVLIYTGAKKDEEVPQPYFDHAIVAVEREDHSYQLMDVTNESAKELFPAYLSNRSYLVAKPGGEALRTSPIVPAEENMVGIETSGAVNAEGTLSGKTSIDFLGINDLTYRSHFSRLKAEERRLYFEGLLKRVVAGVRITDFDLTPQDLLDTSQPLRLRLAYTADNVITGKGETRVLSLPRFDSSIGMVNFILGKMGLEQRKYPLVTEFACGVRERFELVIDKSLGDLDLESEAAPVDDELLKWKRTLAQNERTLNGEGEFVVRAVEFTAKQYLRLKENLRAIEYGAKMLPVLKRAAKADGGSDVEVIEQRVEFELQDEHSWTERHYAKKRVLSYKGKKDNSELHVDFNPAWDAVRLLRATVTNGDDVQEVSTSETNLMDAAWVAAAPRYPGAKTLVASFPGVEVGSIIEYEFERSSRDRPFFAVEAVFRALDPIAKSVVRIIAPRAIGLSIVVDENGAAREGSGAGGGVVAYKERKLGRDRLMREWVVADQAAFKLEDGMPPLWAIGPMLRVSAGHWSEYSKSVSEAFEAAVLRGHEASRRAADLLSGISGAAERVTAIRDFVVRNVRRSGPHFTDMPLGSLSAADRVLADGYGNSADRAVLLIAMLRAVGVEADPVLVSRSTRVAGLRDFQVQYAKRQLFPLFLVRVRLAGKEVYLNDTNQYAALGATPSDGQLGLDLASGEIKQISVPEMYRSQVKTKLAIVLDDDGDARIDLTEQSYGMAYSVRRKRFAEITPEDRRRYYQQRIADISQSAVAASDLKTDFSPYPGTESFSVKVRRFAVREGDRLYFRLPQSLAGLLSLKSDEHENPFYLNSFRRAHVEIDITVPRGFRRLVLAPPNRRWGLPNGAGSISETIVAKLGDNTETGSDLRFSLQAEVRPFIIEANEYPQLLEIDRALSHLSSRLIMLEGK